MPNKAKQTRMEKQPGARPGQKIRAAGPRRQALAAKTLSAIQQSDFPPAARSAVGPFMAAPVRRTEVLNDARGRVLEL